MAAAVRSDLLRQVGLRSATALVVANIVGAGIFTTTGFQAADLGHAGLIYLVWIVGGVLALSGALCYGELGAAMPDAGGEYVYLRETYGRPLAFMSAFVSLVAGFSAPVAAALKSLVRYLTHFFPSLQPDEPWILGLSEGDTLAVVLVWTLVLIHGAGVRGGLAVSDWLTLLKVVGIALFVIVALALGKGTIAGLTSATPVFDTVRAEGALAPAIATSLVFVMFCYSGWNAAAYMAGEMKTPERDLPRSLLYGTGLVVLLYLGLNATYLYAVGLEGIEGEVEVGLIAARGLFGGLGVTLVASVISVSILASASAMTIAGPRVYYAFGRDYEPMRWLAALGGRGGPPMLLWCCRGW
jgi:APA family basic amino acid/polyamine antiporter